MRIRIKRYTLAFLGLFCALCLAFGVCGAFTERAFAATKRTIIAESLLLSNGRINPADWEMEGDETKAEVTNNGNVFEFAKDAGIGYRIMAMDAIEAGKGFSMYFDVIKTDAANAKINIAGMTEGVNEGAKSNVFVSSLGLDPGAGTDWAAADYDRTAYTPDGLGTVDASLYNIKLEAGYRYVFTMRPSQEKADRADLLYGRAPIGEEVVEQAMFKSLLYLDNTKPHYAMLFAPTAGSAVVIDNFKVQDSDGNVRCDLNFDDGSMIGSDPTVPIAGGIWTNGGSIKSDTYLTLNSPAADDRLVTILGAKKDENSADALLVNASVRLDSNLGKAGFLFGMPDAQAAIGDSVTSFLYFEQGETTTKVNVQTGTAQGTAQDLGVDLRADFTALEIRIKTDGTLTVSVGGEVKATFTGCCYEGLIGLVTDGTEGAKISFLPELTIDNFEYVTGEGADLANNFNSGWMNPEYYVIDGYPAANLGGNGHGIVVQDGVLLFDGTSDGSHFALTGTYADFILQFDWINYPWEDRPTNEEGMAGVPMREKPEDGRGVEMYSPLGICFGKTSPTGGWTENQLYRLYDDLNLIQQNLHGVANNVTMGRDFFSPEACADIQPGKIDFYENTVNIKMIVRNNTVEFWGAIHNDPNETPEHSLLATFAIENYKGYVSISTTESGYFAIDNLRITKIDGWTDEQVAAYEDYIAIPDEAKPDPVQLAAPVLSAEGNTISWSPIDKATGYEVYVNGEKQGETIAVCTYTFAETEPGVYNITVKAVGDGDLYLTSEDSAAVSITIEEQTQEPPQEQPEPETGGCNGAMQSAMLPLAALLAGSAVVAALRRRRKQ